ncbi:nucleotidyltransferase domain-containing protein [Streptomyces sp. DSM 41527]|uniref:Nucleotidyltransferase domain-containing protein n=1 Tax=Streptomyces mooreae TaxID=3075523 RepID=A0ABU2TCI9_9ACTN|nr:nucleotidyltransferase domain-containing protein [Streptomyces sp. DSM 41527]MDT0458661.1 nucleotidyltransferase domain-containing protein [Streptomyces sp. DSM 41527]
MPENPAATGTAAEAAPGAAPGTASGAATAREDVLRAAGLPAVDLRAVVAEQDDPLVFATVSGAHLYGFPSRDSDVDLRGAHLLPAAALLGLYEPEESRTRMWEQDGTELDLVSHDLRKFARLLLRRNGYVLEQLVSPLVVHTTPVHDELLALVPDLLTSHHAHHYRGFAGTQWRLFEKTGELKPLLYTLRVLLTGIHLMESGRVEPHLPTLAGESAAPAYLPELIAAKEAAEHGTAGGVVDPERLRGDVEALHARLDTAQDATALPDAPGAREALHDLVVRARTHRPGRS